MLPDSTNESELAREMKGPSRFEILGFPLTLLDVSHTGEALPAFWLDLPDSDAHAPFATYIKKYASSRILDLIPTR